MTLTPFDDYPIHQTALPVAHPASGDRNHYDRYFFNGYSIEGDWFFACAMGVYPNRGVIDAAFSIVHDGVQRSVFSSGRAPVDRSVTHVGPLSIEVVEPLRTLRVRVNAPAHGVIADVLWDARTPVVEEPRMTIMDDTRVVLDSTRLVQWGTWRGRVETGGASLDVVPERTRGTRDRSWGVRPVGEPDAGAPSGLVGGGLFFLWAPVHFSDTCTHLAHFENPRDGTFYASAESVPLLAPRSALYGVDTNPASVSYSLALHSGTRWMSGATLEYRWRDGAVEGLSFEPLLRFHMKGIGYFHPEWGHGYWHGDAAEHGEVWKTDEMNPTDPTNFHVENLCRVRRGNETGIGVMEQLILGPHSPTGLGGFVDVAP